MTAPAPRNHPAEAIADAIKAERDECLATFDRDYPYNRGVLYGLAVAHRIARGEASLARDGAEAAEVRLARVRAYVDHPGNWSGLDGRRTALLALIDGKENGHV